MMCCAVFLIAKRSPPFPEGSGEANHCHPPPAEAAEKVQGHKRRNSMNQNTQQPKLQKPKLRKERQRQRELQRRIPCSAPAPSPSRPCSLLTRSLCSPAWVSIPTGFAPILQTASNPAAPSSKCAAARTTKIQSLPCDSWPPPPRTTPETVAKSPRDLPARVRT